MWFSLSTVLPSLTFPEQKQNKTKSPRDEGGFFWCENKHNNNYHLLKTSICQSLCEMLHIHYICSSRTAGQGLSSPLGRWRAWNILKFMWLVKWQNQKSSVWLLWSPQSAIPPRLSPTFCPLITFFSHYHIDVSQARKEASCGQSTKSRLKEGR